MTAAERVALVTGGATGIGRATCLELARRGIRDIHIGYARSADAAASLVAELAELGATGHPLRIDVSGRDAVGDAAASLLATSGGLDILVNSAGTTQKIDFTDLDAITPELWDEILGTNLLGAFWVCQAFAETLKARGGSIVNVSSISATRVVGSSLPYSVSKAAVIHFARMAAQQYAADRIRVNTVIPGLIDTPRVAKNVARMFDADARAASAARDRQVPMGRMGTPWEVANAVAFLASDEASYITGTELLVDGGLTGKYA